MSRDSESRWSVQEARKRFGVLLDAAVSEGPQIVVRRGVETAVVLSVEEWRRLEEDGRAAEARRQSLLVSGHRSEEETLEFLEGAADDRGWV